MEVKRNQKDTRNAASLLFDCRELILRGKLSKSIKHEMGSVQSYLIFSIRFGLLLLLILTGLLLQRRQLRSSLIQVLSRLENEIWYRIIQVTLNFLRFFISNIIINAVLVSSNRSFFAKWNTDLLKHCVVISEFDLFLSGSMLMVNFYQNLFNFVCSGCFNLFVAVYLENYTERRSVFYCSSSIINIFFKLFVILGYTTNAVLFIAAEQNIGVAVILILALFGYCWGLKYGVSLYFHQRARMTMNMYISILGTICYLLIQNIVLKRCGYQSTNDICKFIIIVPVIYLFTKSVTNRDRLIIDYHSTIQAAIDPKHIDLLLEEMFERQSENREISSTLLGMFSLHQTTHCSNVQCFTHRSQLYDPLIQQHVNVEGEARAKQSSFRYYLKCLFENIFIKEQSWRNKNLLISYCEFLYAEFANPYTISLVISKIKHLNLNVLENLKLEHIRLSLKEKLSSTNTQLYHGKLFLEEVIESEQIFEEINNAIFQYMSNNIKIWQRIRQDEVDLSAMLADIDLNFVLLEQTTSKWHKLSKYFPTNKPWRYIYSNYICYLLNQRKKLKQTFSDDKESQLFHQQKKYYQNIKQLDQMNESILFHPESFCISAVMVNQQLTIHKISKNCEKHLQFTQKELVNTELERLIPEEYQESHQRMVRQWMENGYLNNQQYYKPKFTHILNKQGNRIPIIKYFKFFMNSSGNIQFVAFIKINNKNNVEFSQSYHPTLHTLQQDAIPADQNTTKYNKIYKHFLSKAEQQSNRIDPSANIFLKQDNLMPRSEFSQITLIKKTFRIYTLLTVISIIVLLLFTQFDANHILDYSSQYINFMSLYRYPVSLGVNYMKHSLSVGNQQVVGQQIVSSTAMVQQLVMKPETIRTLFDQNLNLPKIYFPFINNTINSNQSYNQIDLFFMIQSSVTSLSDLPFERTDYDFIQFNSYLKPSYDNLMNTTKYQFHNSFSEVFKKIQTKQLIVAICQICLFFTVCIVSLVRLTNFSKKMNRVLMIIIELNPSQILQILTYLNKIYQHFDRLRIMVEYFSDNPDQKEHEKQLASSTKIKSLLHNQSVFMNNKIKTIIPSKELIMRQKKIYAAVIFFILIVMLTVASIEIVTYISVEKLILFQKGGFFFLQYFPTASLVSYGCLEKYYNSIFPNETTFYPDRYQDVLASMQMFAHNEYIGQLTEDGSLYYTKEKKYFFQNLCEFNQKPLLSLKIDKPRCEEISNRTFTKGLSNFMRSAVNHSKSYINGQRNLSPAEIDELTVSFSIAAVYILDAIETWTQEFASKVEEIKYINSYESIGIVGLIIFVHLFLFQWLLLGKLNAFYSLVSKIYLHFMPENVLLREKIITQKFIQMDFFKGV